MIRVSDLEFQYETGDFRLEVPELTVPKGTSAAVIGPSGSGKTTLLNLVAGIALPSAGCVVVGGRQVSSLGDAARREFRIRKIGLVFQEFELLEHLNVLDNILLPYRISSSLRLDGAVRDRAAALAGEVGISDKLGRYVRRLSQGERQRVAVCRALLTEPDLLLCDEPTGNLDPVNKENVLDILFNYAAASRTTLLAVTHDHELLGRFEKVIDFKQFHQVLQLGGACAGGKRRKLDRW